MVLGSRGKRSRGIRNRLLQLRLLRWPGGRRPRVPSFKALRSELRCARVHPNTNRRECAVSTRVRELDGANDEHLRRRIVHWRHDVLLLARARGIHPIDRLCSTFGRVCRALRLTRPSPARRRLLASLGAGVAFASAAPPTNFYPALWLGMAVLAF